MPSRRNLPICLVLIFEKLGRGRAMIMLLLIIRVILQVKGTGYPPPTLSIAVE